MSELVSCIFYSAQEGLGFLQSYQPSSIEMQTLVLLFKEEEEGKEWNGVCQCISLKLILFLFLRP